MPTSEPSRIIVCRATKQVPCLQRAKHGSKETCNLLQRAGMRDSCRLEKEKKPNGEKVPASEPQRNIIRRATEQVPCLQRAKHGSKETRNLLQRAGVTDSCRLEEKKNQWGKSANLRTTKEYCPQSHQTGSIFAACKNMDQREPATFFSHQG